MESDMYYKLNARDKLESLDIKYFGSRKSFPSCLWRGGGRTYPGKKLLLFKIDHPLIDLKTREDLQTEHHKQLIRTPAGAFNCVRNIKTHKLALLYNPIFD